jgi:hypothetical protein
MKPDAVFEFLAADRHDLGSAIGGTSMILVGAVISILVNSAAEREGGPKSHKLRAFGSEPQIYTTRRLYPEMFLSILQRLCRGSPGARKQERRAADLPV